MSLTHQQVTAEEQPPTLSCVLTLFSQQNYSSPSTLLHIIFLG